MNTSNITCTPTASEPCHYTIEINIPTEEVNSVFHDVVETFMNHAKLPGFRQGKIPHNLIKRRFAEKITDEVKQELIRTSLQTAIEQSDKKPISAPAFKNDRIDDVKENHPFSYSVEFDVAPKVTLPNYKEIKIDFPEVEPSDKEVDNAIELIRNERATYEKVDSPATENDMLKVSYSAELVEEEIPESAAKLLTSDETWLILKEPEILPGIIEGLKGASGGSDINLTIAFPEDFHENFLSGKSISYTINVHEVHSSTTPELNDDFAKTFGTESLDVLKSLLKQKLFSEKMAQSKALVQNQVNDYLLNETPSLPLPQKILEQEKYYTLVSRIMEKQEQNKYTTGEEIGENKDELQKDVNKEAENRLKLNYIVQEIAKQEEIEINQEEINSYFNRVKDQHEREARKQNRKFDAEELKSKIGANILNSKVFEKLIEYGQANKKDDK